MSRAERGNKPWRNTGQLCSAAGDTPYQKASPALNVLPDFQHHQEPPARIFQDAQPISPCPSNAGEALVPSSTTALPLPGHGPVGPYPNLQADIPATHWTCLLVPRFCPILLLSPGLIPASDLPLHHLLPRGSGLWADSSCHPKAHPAHLVWRQQWTSPAICAIMLGSPSFWEQSALVVPWLVGENTKLLPV